MSDSNPFKSQLASSAQTAAEHFRELLWRNVGYDVRQHANYSPNHAHTHGQTSLAYNPNNAHALRHRPFPDFAIVNDVQGERLHVIERNTRWERTFCKETLPHDFPTEGAFRDHIREVFLREQTSISLAAHTALQAKYESLRNLFNTLFNVDPDTVSPPVCGADPTAPGQWRIRVHVKAFAIETTVGALAVAKANPDAARSWAREARSIVDTGFASVERAVETRILDSNNRIESIQPPPQPAGQIGGQEESSP